MFHIVPIPSLSTVLTPIAFVEYISAIHWGIWLSGYYVKDIHELISPKAEAVPGSHLTLVTL